MPSGLEALACSGEASANAPLTRWPVALVLGSATVRVASPAVEVTVAVVVAKESLATPGVNAPNDAAGPSVRLSVAGTEPPTSPLADVE